MKTHPLLLFVSLLVLTYASGAQDLAIYNLRSYQLRSGKYIALLSLSDHYITEQSDSSIPVWDYSDSLENIKMDGGRYIKLQGQYRENLLKGTNISEDDKAYMYDYGRNVLSSVPIKKLSAVACINIYDEGKQGPFSASQYMIGFEIDEKYVKGFGPDYSTVLVYVGKDNPFELGKMMPVVWKASGPKEYPAAFAAAEDTLRSKLGKDSTGGTYKYEDAEYKYFVRDYFAKTKIALRHLVIINAKNNEVVCDYLYKETESYSPAALNYVEISSAIQYAGKLFKNRPSVITGLESVSFGCPTIAVMDGSSIEINCSNFH